MKKNLSAVLLSSIMSLSVCLPGFSETVTTNNSATSITQTQPTLGLTKMDIENSEEFQKKKAEIKYTRIGNETVREVYINGFRVNDRNLPMLVKDKTLESKIGSAVSSRRVTWIASAGLGIPVGGLLLYMAATSRAALPVNNNPPPIGQFNTAGSTDFKTFLFGTLGAVVTLYAVVNSVSLINDMTGMNSPQVLKDKDAEDVVKKYNENLKEEMLKKVSNNLSSSNLSVGSNNIMILNVNKSF